MFLECNLVDYILRDESRGATNSFSASENSPIIPRCPDCESKKLGLRYLTLSSEGGFVVPLNFATAQPLGPKTILPAIEALVARLA